MPPRLDGDAVTTLPRRNVHHVALDGMAHDVGVPTMLWRFAQAVAAYEAAGGDLVLHPLLEKFASHHDLSEIDFLDLWIRREWMPGELAASDRRGWHLWLSAALDDGLRGHALPPSPIEQPADRADLA